MSLHEVWEAAASSPFQPTVGKDSQAFVGLILLLTGLILAGLFGLNRSLTAVPLYGIPASLCFGIGAVYTICGAGVYVFSAVSTSVRQLFLILRCISFAPKAEVRISKEGLRFCVDEARVVQGITFLDKALFTSYDLYTENEDLTELPPFAISMPALLETLQIFGLQENSYKSSGGGFSSSATNAFTTPALALAGSCRLSYSEEGAPLSITIIEGPVTTTAEIHTYALATAYDDDGTIPLDRTSLCLKTIMPSTFLADAIAELSGTNPDVLLLNASSRAAPYLSLEGLGGSLGDAVVEYLSEAKNEPGLARNKKQPSVTETFSVTPGPDNHGRLKTRYKFELIKKAGRAMQLASKVSVRQDTQGVLSLQFLVDSIQMNASNATQASGGSNPLFIDYRFLPLVDEDEADAQAGPSDLDGACDDDDESYDPVDADENSDQDAAPSSAPLSKKRKRASGDTANPTGTFNKYADLLPRKMPACYVSKQDNRFFTVAWFKEISARDAFWSDWIGKISKSVMKARFEIPFNKKLDGNEQSQVPLITQQRRVRDKPDPTTAKPSAYEEGRSQVVTEANNEGARQTQEDADQLAVVDDQEADKHAVIAAPHLNATEATELQEQSTQCTARISTPPKSTPELPETTPAWTSGSPSLTPNSASPLKLKIIRPSEASADDPHPKSPPSDPKHAPKRQAGATEPKKGHQALQKAQATELKPSTPSTLPRAIMLEIPTPPQDIKPKLESSSLACPADSISYATFIHDGENHFVKQEALRAR